MATRLFKMHSWVLGAVGQQSPRAPSSQSLGQRAPAQCGLLPSTQPRDCSLMATGRKGRRGSGCGQKATSHRILGNLYAGSGRKPARGGVPNPSDTQCVLITQRTFSTAPLPPQAPHPDGLEVKVLTALGPGDPATPAPGPLGERVRCRSGEEARGQGEFPESQIETKMGPKFKKRKHPRLSLAGRVLER